MNLNLKATGVTWTPALKIFVEQKLNSLSRFVQKFDAGGAAELRVEIARTTQHHRKGDVFYAEANLRLPNALVRAEESAPDLRVAINRLRHVLEIEIMKYKTKSAGRSRRATPRA